MVVFSGMRCHVSFVVESRTVSPMMEYREPWAGAGSDAGLGAGFEGGAGFAAATVGRGLGFPFVMGVTSSRIRAPHSKGGAGSRA
jgi:hypothetical protein